MISKNFVAAKFYTCRVISHAMLGVLTISKNPTLCFALNSPYSENVNMQIHYFQFRNIHVYIGILSKERGP
jgi:hypothetical protein